MLYCTCVVYKLYITFYIYFCAIAHVIICIVVKERYTCMWYVSIGMHTVYVPRVCMLSNTFPTYVHVHVPSMDENTFSIK